MKISIIDPTTDSRWDRFTNDQALSTIFHTSAWASVIKEAYGYLPRYYILENEAGQIKAAVPLYGIRSRFTGERLICLPFSDYCYPLGVEGTDVSFLLEFIKKDVKSGKATYLEIRGWQNGINPAELDLVARDYHLTYLIDLEPGVDAVRKQFHLSVRRGIHQAETRGATVHKTCTEDGLENFYRLNLATRKKLGVLPQPLAFFRALNHHIFKNNLGFIFLAEWEGKTIAGVLFLIYKDTIYYKFNASDENYLRKRPNHLLIWEAIRYACANGYHYFDFGRCSEEEESLRAFKSLWGAKEINLPYYYYPKVRGFATTPENSMIYRSMRLFSHVMPKSAFRIAGSLIYKHLA